MVEEILSDSSPGKSDSHMKLKLLVAKDPKIFETRVYTQQDLVDICALYGKERVKTKPKTEL